jgi:hypothetical protein
MWINSPLGKWEMKERTRRIHAPQELGRWRREVEDAKRARRVPRSTGALAGIVLALGHWCGLRAAKWSA